jgi:small basic protein
MGEDRYELLIFIHRLVGYPTAFLIAPAALLAFARPAIHRQWGKAYLYLLTFLYLTGTFLTFVRHDWYSWEFVRNVVFNFFGFSMVLYGWRAIYLFRKPGQPSPNRLDWALAGLLAGTVLGLLVVAAVRDTPMRLFALVGIVFCVLEFHELRAGFQPKSVLFRRHTRFILTSYFYVLTVVSIVHLGDELPRDLKWIWPTLFGGVIIAATGNAAHRLAQPRGRVLRLAIGTTLLVTLLYAGYVVYDLNRGTFMGQGDAQTRKSDQSRTR